MKRNKLKIIFTSIILAFCSYSCQDYLDVNDDPNNPANSELNPETVLTGAQSLTVSTLSTTMNGLGNLMLATWSGNSVQFQTPYNDEFKYDIDRGFYGGIWSGLMARTANLTYIENYQSDLDYTEYYAAAKILKSFYFQYLVDLYGDIPYSEAHQRDTILFPKYDDQEDVYRSLMTQLNEAIDLIDNVNTSSSVNLGSNDLMFDGNLNLWKQFANTIKLRILVRQTAKAEMEGGAYLTYLNEEYAKLNQPDVEFLSTDVTLNPGYQDASGKQNPFWAVYGFQPLDGNATTSNRITGITTFMAEFLDGTTTGVEDDRLNQLFEGNNGNTQGGLGNPSDIGPGLLVSPDQDAVVMTASESLFLQAEAANDNYLTNVNAANAFQQGVRASFNYLGLTTTDADNYLLMSSNTPLIGWDSPTDRKEVIITQKWIALAGTSGIETWIEYTRTGYPSNMPLSESATSTTRPIRLLYPNSEYSGNTVNVSAFNQTNSTAFDTPIFWDVN